MMFVCLLQDASGHSNGMMAVWMIARIRISIACHMMLLCLEVQNGKDNTSLPGNSISATTFAWNADIFNRPSQHCPLVACAWTISYKSGLIGSLLVRFVTLWSYYKSI